MKDALIPVHVEGYKLEIFDDEILLFDIAKDESIYLNTSAATIWKACDGYRDVGQISKLISQHYPEQSATVEKDTLATLDMLAQYGAISFC